MRIVVSRIVLGAICLQLVNCCEQDFCSSVDGSSNDPEVTYTSSVTGCDGCGDHVGAGGFSGSDPGVILVSSSVSVSSSTSTTSGNPGVNPWGPGCDWCNGPGCETYDESCIDVEPDSRSLVCRDRDSEPISDQNGSLCFTTTDRDNDRVLCCFNP